MSGRASPRPRLRALAAAGVALLGVGASAPALANGRFPRADQLLAVPGRPAELWLRATFGLLLSADAGQSWDWVCERGVGFTGEQDPALGVFADGVLLAGLTEGLSRSHDGGCSWAFAEVPRGAPGDTAGERWPITDLSVRPDASGSAVALAWEPQPVTASTPGYRARFFVTGDGGQAWTPYGDGLEPSVLALTVDVAPSDPRRLYASGIRPGARRTAALFVSVDEGASWQERPVPLDAREQGLYIAAVDPNVPERVYLRTSSATSSRLLVTHDAGASFEERYAGGPMLGFALAPDGSSVYLGGLQDGLWVAPSATLAFERRSDVPIQCLLRTRDALYACSNDGAGFTVGVSSDDGFGFTPLLRLANVRGPLACPAAASAAVCSSEWPLAAARLGIEPVAAETPAPPTRTQPADSGCALGWVSGGWLSLAAGLALTLLAATRRRR